MKLYVMRHGPAEDVSASGHDHDRVLTRRGKDRVRDVATLLAREGELPERILTSRLARANETAAILASIAEHKGWAGSVETAPEMAPGGKNGDLVLRLLAEGKASLVVGHEPDLSSLIDQLLHDPFPLPMDKAMVVALELEAEAPAKLRFIVDPVAVAVVHDTRERS